MELPGSRILPNPGSSPNVLSGHTRLISSVALTPDGRWALTGSDDGTARLWDLANLSKRPRVFEGHTEGIVSVALTPDGTWALTGSYDTTARLWELIPRPSFAEVQRIIGIHEETTRNNNEPGVQCVCG